MDRTSAAPVSTVPALYHEAVLVRNGVDQATANLIVQVNAASVTVDDMFLASAEIQKLPLATCNREARTRCLARTFDGQNYKVMAVNARLEAMARMVSSEQMRRWVLPNIVCEVVFLVAAKEPLLFIDNRWTFDQDSFVGSVLENATVDGHS